MKPKIKKFPTPPKFTGDTKKYTLEFFDRLCEEAEENRIVELNEKKRQVNEKAKSRF